MKEGRSKNWCFTINGYTQAYLEYINGMLNNYDKIQYAIIGKEEAPTTG